MAVQRCKDCGKHIQWLATKYGKKLPFNYPPISVEQDTAEAGWIPGEWQVRYRKVIVLAPVTHYGRRKRDQIRHVITIHTCAEYRARVANVMYGRAEGNQWS